MLITIFQAYIVNAMEATALLLLCANLLICLIDVCPKLAARIWGGNCVEPQTKNAGDLSQMTFKLCVELSRGGTRARDVA